MKTVIVTGASGGLGLSISLRLIEKGYGVRMVELESSTIAVDTKEDLKKVLLKLNG